jgi:hypothetical protein
MERASRRAPSDFCAIRCKGVVFGPDFLLLRNATEVLGYVAGLDALEIVNLAAGKNGRDYLVLLGRGQNEDRIGRRLLQGFEECVEGRVGQHVHLIDDVYLVHAELRRIAHLIDEIANVLNRIVGSGVELVDVERIAPAFSRGVKIVDEPGQNPGTGGFSHTARAAEKHGLGRLSAVHGVLKGRGDVLLPDHLLEPFRAVLARRYDVIAHDRKIMKVCG